MVQKNYPITVVYPDMSETEVVANIEVVDNNINAKAIATTVVEGKASETNTKVIQAKVDSFTVTGNEIQA